MSRNQAPEAMVPDVHVRLSYVHCACSRYQELRPRIAARCDQLPQLVLLGCHYHHAVSSYADFIYS